MKKIYQILGVVALLTSMASYAQDFSHNQITHNEVDCAKKFKGCNFLGEWKGTCESYPDAVSTVNFNSIGSVSIKRKKEYNVNLDNIRYSLSHTRSDLYNDLFGQSATYSTMRAIDENKITLTSKELFYHSNLNVEASITDTKTNFEIVGSNLIKTVSVKRSSEELPKTDKCTYSKVQ